MTKTETVGTSREERMVVIERDEAGYPTIWCDPEIADLVTALNAGSVPTIASCSGHGYRPGSIALKDGRWLVVAKDDAEHDALEAIFLTDINGDPITPKHPLSDDGLRAIAGKQFGINDPDLCAQLAAELLASRTQSPAEWQVVPQKMRMDGDAAKAITFMLGSADEDDDTPLDAILWVGDLEGDDGKPVHGLHLANAEYPEEGSITLVEFDALRAASIPAPERSKEETGVRVKPLEWNAPYGHGASPYYWVICAQTQTKGYRIDWEGYGLNHTNHPGPFKLMDIGKFKTIEEAKAAAQADYEQRILSALETPPLHKKGEAVYFAEGNTVRKRVGSAFGEGDVLFCTPSAWFPANEVADLLNAAPAPVPVTITNGWLRDTAMNVMLATEVEEATRILSAAISKPGEQG